MVIGPNGEQRISTYSITYGSVVVISILLIVGYLGYNLAFNHTHGAIIDNTMDWMEGYGVFNNTSSVTITKIVDPPFQSSAPYGVYFITDNTNVENVIWVSQYTLKPIESNGNIETVKNI